MVGNEFLVNTEVREPFLVPFIYKTCMEWILDIIVNQVSVEHVSNATDNIFFMPMMYD